MHLDGCRCTSERWTTPFGTRKAEITLSTGLTEGLARVHCNDIKLIQNAVKASLTSHQSMEWRLRALNVLVIEVKLGAAACLWCRMQQTTLWSTMCESQHSCCKTYMLVLQGGNFREHNKHRQDSMIQKQAHKRRHFAGQLRAIKLQYVHTRKADHVFDSSARLLTATSNTPECPSKQLQLAWAQTESTVWAIK